MALTLVRGHNVNGKQKPLGFVFLYTFHPDVLKVVWCWTSSSSAFWFFSWMRVCRSREIAAVLLTSSKTIIIGMHSNIYEPNHSKLGSMIDSTELYILKLVQVTLTLIQGHRDVRKQKLLGLLSHKALNGFRRRLMRCWDLLVWWSSYLVYLVWSIFKADNTSWWFCLQKFNIGLHLDIYKPISFLT